MIANSKMEQKCLKKAYKTVLDTRSNIHYKTKSSSIFYRHQRIHQLLSLKPHPCLPLTFHVFTKCLFPPFLYLFFSSEFFSSPSAKLLFVATFLINVPPFLSPLFFLYDSYSLDFWAHLKVLTTTHKQPQPFTNTHKNTHIQLYPDNYLEPVLKTILIPSFGIFL